jgi:TolA-binding protein
MMRKNMNRYIWLTIIVLVTILPGCRSTFEKRVKKDITGINEQLYDLEKEQIKTAQDVEKLKQSGVADTTANSAISSNRNLEKEPLIKPKIQPKDQDEQETIYKEGYKYFLEQNYEKTIEVLSELTGQFSDNPVTDNALYWQAESYYKLNQIDRALTYYQLVYRYFPFSNKADYALFKIGTIYLDRKDYNRALSAFTRLVDEYPASDLYKAAAIKINEIKKDNKRRK